MQPTIVPPVGYPRMEALLDLIYEAAAIPELWPEVLHRVSQYANCHGGMLMTIRPESFRWLASPNLEQLTADWVAGGWMNRNSRTPRMLALQRQGFIHELDAFASIEEIHALPEYAEFLHPHGFGWGAGTFVPIATADTLVFSIERRYEQGPCDAEIINRLDALRPHLARAGLLSARLQAARDQTMVDSLGLLGIPALTLAENGRVLATNALVEGLTAQVKWLGRDRMTFIDDRAAKFFAGAMQEIADDSAQKIRSFAVRSGEGSANLVAHLIPVRRQARDVFSRACAVLTIVPATAPEAPGADLLQALFDLTPAEAKAARLLTQGRTLNQIAQERTVSLETVRSQLKAVYQKSGTSRQSELVALLNGIPIKRET